MVSLVNVIGEQEAIPYSHKEKTVVGSVFHMALVLKIIFLIFSIVWPCGWR